MAKRTTTPTPAPAPYNPRDLELIGIAMRLGIDSDDLDAACRQAGIDPYAADNQTVYKAAAASFGLPTWR